MTESGAVIEDLYAAFNKRDIESALALMTEDVSWPKASEGGTVVGKAAIRAYWSRQWSEFDPHAEPVGIHVDAEKAARVQVHQLVKDREGNLLSDSEVVHLYTFSNGLVVAMRLEAGVDGEASPSEAFVHRSAPTPS